MERIGKANAKHLYEIGVKKDGLIGKIEVTADSSAQAAKFARGAGYEVRDVNMVG